MDGLSSRSTAARYIASQLGEERFTLVDVGAAGGVHPAWRIFGPRLHAWGFDPDVLECLRLNAAETLPGIRYVPGFVGVPSDDPIVLRRQARPYIQRNPWDRLSATRTMALRERRIDCPCGREAVLADPASPIVLAEFLRRWAIDDIDVIKIDVDGADFEILQSLKETIVGCGVLAMGLEVNFVGTQDETDHTFHNTDRFMRSLGFDLFNLTVRSYSTSALPARYQFASPSRTERGRPLQGDALYVRDFGDPQGRDASDCVSIEKLAKTAAVFGLFGLPDCAAEVLLTHRIRLAGVLDVDRALDLLAADAQGSGRPVLSYKDYMAAFERDDEMFYPAA